ncbi:MAG: LysM domain-containing protein [Anaerolineales bacterium]|nr:LysM domain-containing protein [Anaerolineales bacterium]
MITRSFRPLRRMASGVLILAAILAGCRAAPVGAPSAGQPASPTPDLPASEPTPSPLSSRPAYAPGELVEYFAQAGDTLPAVAAHFNTTVEEIKEANPIIPDNATTLPPGLPMQIPIYFQPFWGSAYQIIPDSLYVNGPSQSEFNTAEFVAGHPGWLKGHVEFAAGANRSGAEMVDYIAEKYSISPQLLLALLEYEAGVLSNSSPSQEAKLYPLGNRDPLQRGVFLQMSWAADLLNDGYYRWRNGTLNEYELQDGRVERPDPWQNAASVTLQSYFSSRLQPDKYAVAIGPDGLANTFRALFGDPWENDQPHIPGSLNQPEMILPFEPGKTWAYTGGPHTAWGEGEPLAALDFAPPAVAGGCNDSNEWATAPAAGVVARTELGTVVLDLDSDGDERTGWVLFFFHIATEDRIQQGTEVQTGTLLGHPSCEGGKSTGTHFHIARKYNGEWIPADSAIPFNLGGWIASAGEVPYQGTLTRFGQTVRACVCSNQASQLQAGE